MYIRKSDLFKTLCAFGALFCNSGMISAQNTSILWAQHQNDNSTFVTARPTADGGYIAVGGINPLGNASSAVTAIAGEDAWLVKMNDTGGIVWQRSYGGSSFERFIEVLPTPDGGYLAAGYTKSADGDVTGNNGGSDIWVVKTDDTGAMQWSKCYGGTKHEQINTILFGAGISLMSSMMQPTPDGGYIITGTTTSNDKDVSGFHGGTSATSEGYGDIWMIKIDSLGTLKWQKCIGGSMNEWASTVLNTPDGGFIIGAVTSSSDGDAAGSGQHGGRHSISQGGDYWVIKTDGSGTIEWQKCYGGGKFEVTAGLIASREGGYLIAGSSYSTDGDVSAQISGIGNYTKPWLVKINNTGSIEWERSYWIDSSTNGFGTANWETVLNVIQSLDGSYHLMVTSDRFHGIVRIDSLGNVMNLYNHFGDKRNPTGLFQLPDGSYIGIGGYKRPYDTRTSNTDTPQALIMKYAACPAYTYSEAIICKGSSYTFGSQTITTAGIYWDTLTMASGCDSLIRLTLTMDSVTQPHITNDKGVLSTTDGYATYQWLKDGSPVSTGGTSYTYTAFEAGNYQVVVSNANGCTDTSGAYPYAPSSISEPSLFSNMKLYPNPASHVVNIEIPQFQGKATVELTSSDGRIITMSCPEIS